MHYDGSMSVITLKDVPPSVHRALKVRARNHGRSLNKEIITTLTETLHATRVEATAIGQHARAVRETMTVYLTPQDLTVMKRAGRR